METPNFDPGGGETSQGSGEGAETVVANNGGPSVAEGATERSDENMDIPSGSAGTGSSSGEDSGSGGHQAEGDAMIVDDDDTPMVASKARGASARKGPCWPQERRKETSDSDSGITGVCSGSADSERQPGKLVNPEDSRVADPSDPEQVVDSTLTRLSKLSIPSLTARDVSSGRAPTAPVTRRVANPSAPAHPETTQITPRSGPFSTPAKGEDVNVASLPPKPKMGQVYQAIRSCRGLAPIVVPGASELWKLVELAEAWANEACKILQLKVV